MSCKCNKYNIKNGRNECNIIGDECIFLIPDSILCGEIFGESTDTDNNKYN